MNRRIFLLTVLSLTGCGGSGGGGGPPVPVTVLIPSTNARDGNIRSDGAVQVTGGLFVGDVDHIIPGGWIRAVVGFDLLANGVPAGATIQSAQLALEQGVGVGNPYVLLGNVIVDHVDLGTVLDGSDGVVNTLLAAVGDLSWDLLYVVWSLEVGARVQADLAAGRTFSDFRFRFPSDSNGNGLADYVRFNDSENSSGFGQKPVLKVTYLP